MTAFSRRSPSHAHLTHKDAGLWLKSRRQGQETKRLPLLTASEAALLEVGFMDGCIRIIRGGGEGRGRVWKRHFLSPTAGYPLRLSMHAG